MEDCGFYTIGIGGGDEFRCCFKLWSHEDTTMTSEESPDNRAAQWRVWAKEAKRKEEEELMFLKQKSSEKDGIKCSTNVR